MKWVRFDTPTGYWLVDDIGWVFTYRLTVPTSGVLIELTFPPAPTDYIYLCDEWVSRSEGDVWMKHWAHKDHAWFHPTYSDD